MTTTQAAASGKQLGEPLLEVKNLKMKVESLTSRLEFNERRARALEGVVVYKPLEGAARAEAAPQPARPLHRSAAVLRLRPLGAVGVRPFCEALVDETLDRRGDVVGRDALDALGSFAKTQGEAL